MGMAQGATPTPVKPNVMAAMVSWNRLVEVAKNTGAVLHRHSGAGVSRYGRQGSEHSGAEGSGNKDSLNQVGGGREHHWSVLSQTTNDSEVSPRVKQPLAPWKRLGAGRYVLLRVALHAALSL